MKTPSSWIITLLATAGVVAAAALGATAFRVAGDESPGLSAGSVAAGEPLSPAAITTTAADRPAPARSRGSNGSGRALFVANCGGCHTVAHAGTRGQVGPDLDLLSPSRGDIVEQVVEGGGGMPAFGGVLSERQIQTLASYVSRVTAEGQTTTARSTPSAPPPAPRTTTGRAVPSAPAPRTTTTRSTPPPPAPRATTTRSTPPAPAPAPQPTVTESDDDDSGKGRGRGRGRGRGGDDDRDD